MLRPVTPQPQFGGFMVLSSLKPEIANVLTSSDFDTFLNDLSAREQVGLERKVFLPGQGVGLTLMRIFLNQGTQATKQAAEKQILDFVQSKLPQADQEEVSKALKTDDITFHTSETDGLNVIYNPFLHARPAVMEVSPTTEGEAAPPST
jgi:hypothetical protein